MTLQFNFQDLPSALLRWESPESFLTGNFIPLALAAFEHCRQVFP
jgi:hypothetical protein